LKGRLAAELTHDLRRVALAQTARRQRHYQDLRRHLETVDLRRRLGGVAASLDRAQRGLRDAAIRALAAAEARLGATAARLDTLSPMAVLGRGYAVCWNGDKTAIVRDAAAIGIGDAVRVTLARGELACRVETKAAD
jgi:exodeoxyribonuclease VII large subunit